MKTSRHTVAFWLSLAVIFATMLALGWDRGMDVVIDFGRELYVPWRLVEGDVLHRDIAWFNGPLAPWLLEGWMRAFGVSLDALQAFNALLIALAAWIIVRLLRSMTDRLTAWVGAVVFLTAFAVSRQEAVGSYHFLSPYSHGLTMGLVAGLGCLDCLGARRFTLAGACAAAAFLTKAEVSLATLSAAFVMLGLNALDRSQEGSRAAPPQRFGLGMGVVLGLSALRFHHQLGGSGVLRALLGTWPYALESTVRDLPLYQEMRGTADVGLSLTRMAKWTLGLGALVVSVSAAAISASSLAPRFAIATSLLLGAGTAAAALAVAPIKWVLLPVAPLTVIGGAACLWKSQRIVRAKDSGCTKGNGRWVLLAGWLTFAAALLPKVLLQPIPRQYGFALALPATLVLVMLLVHWIPARSTTKKSTGAAMTGMAMIFCAATVYASYGRFSQNATEVGAGGDRLFGDDYRGTVMAELLRDLGQRLEPGEPFLVLPEGVLLNYELRRPTATRLVNFMPPELVFFDESSVIADLESEPPRHVVLLYRPTDVYGYPFIGDGYGSDLISWVQRRYERERLISHEPLAAGEPGDFGAEILTLRR